MSGTDRDEPKAGKGRVLRLKQGFNPNSSSAGSIVFALPATMLVAPVAFGMAAGLIYAACLKGKDVPHPESDGREGSGEGHENRGEAQSRSADASDAGHGSGASRG